MTTFFDYEDPQFRLAYVEEGLVADVQIEIARVMKTKNVTRSELARRLGVSPASITQMLGNEDANLTLRTIARIFDALEEEACLTTKGSKRKRSETSWMTCAAETTGWLHSAATTQGADLWQQAEKVAPSIDQLELANDVVYLDAYRKACERKAA